MNLRFFCPRWGAATTDWNTFMQQVKDAGYDGVEAGIANNTPKKEMDLIWDLAARHDLDIIPQHYEGYTGGFSAYYDAFAAWLEKLKPYPAKKINSQTGKDHYGFEGNSTLIGLADRFTEHTGIPVFHETHRNKFSFAAHITHTYLQQIPHLKLTLDISHWVNVAETYLEDQQEAVQLAIDRTEHLHARVGYPEGPQVPDPAAPEWQEAVNHHLTWWDKLAARKAVEEELTITPEFGPYPYMVHIPYTGQPIASQWDTNIYMMNLLRKRWSNR